MLDATPERPAMTKRLCDKRGGARGGKTEGAGEEEGDRFSQRLLWGFGGATVSSVERSGIGFGELGPRAVLPGNGFLVTRCLGESGNPDVFQIRDRVVAAEAKTDQPWRSRTTGPPCLFYAGSRWVATEPATLGGPNRTVRTETRCSVPAFDERIEGKSFWLRGPGLTDEFYGVRPLRVLRRRPKL